MKTFILSFVFLWVVLGVCGEEKNNPPLTTPLEPIKPLTGGEEGGVATKKVEEPKSSMSLIFLKNPQTDLEKRKKEEEQFLRPLTFLLLLLSKLGAELKKQEEHGAIVPTTTPKIVKKVKGQGKKKLQTKKQKLNKDKAIKKKGIKSEKLARFEKELEHDLKYAKGEEYKRKGAQEKKKPFFLPLEKDEDEEGREMFMNLPTKEGVRQEKFDMDPEEYFHQVPPPKGQQDFFGGPPPPPSSSKYFFFDNDYDQNNGGQNNDSEEEEGQFRPMQMQGMNKGGMMGPHPLFMSIQRQRQAPQAHFYN